MSERGTFITDYIYCPKCLEIAKSVLLSNDKGMCSIIIPSWQGDGKMLPVIAGTIGGSFPGEGVMEFEVTIVPILEDSVCHSFRIAVMGDEGERIFIINPSKT